VQQVAHALVSIHQVSLLFQQPDVLILPHVLGHDALVVLTRAVDIVCILSAFSTLFSYWLYEGDYKLFVFMKQTSGAIKPYFLLKKT
jgi:hypothetical protein